jgi:hypothetical protein
VCRAYQRCKHWDETAYSNIYSTKAFLQHLNFTADCFIPFLGKAMVSICLCLLPALTHSGTIGLLQRCFQHVSPNQPPASILHSEVRFGLHGLHTHKPTASWVAIGLAFWHVCRTLGILPHSVRWGSKTQLCTTHLAVQGNLIQDTGYQGLRINAVHTGRPRFAIPLHCTALRRERDIDPYALNKKHVLQLIMVISTL